MALALNNRWITTIGGMCYSIYLLHVALISAFGRFTMPWTASRYYAVHAWLNAAALALPVLVVCAGYYVLVERPCMPGLATGPGARLESRRARLAGEGLEIPAVVVGKLGGEHFDLPRDDEPHVVGDFLDAGDLQPLARLDRLDEVGGLHQRLGRAGIEPGEAAAEALDVS